MKVIISHSLPFSLAHGGMQTLIQSLMTELIALGVEVEPERWWDPDQTGDILHYVQRPPSGNVQMAKIKGRMTLMTENFDVIASEGPGRLWMRACVNRMARTLSPGYASRLSFYRELDALVYVVPHEWDVVQQIYGLSPGRGSIIPHGLNAKAIAALSKSGTESDYLVSVGTICERKNSVLLAQAALDAQVPVVFLGKPFSTHDPYFQKFSSLIDDRYVRYPGFLSEEEKYQTLKNSRGFVLLSHGESGCIAVYQAAAAGLPLLLADLPWAAKGYPPSNRIHFVRLGETSDIAAKLRVFYATAHRGKEMTFPVGTWADVAQRYVGVYESLLSRR